MLTLALDTVGETVDRLQWAIGAIPTGGVYQTAYWAEQAAAFPTAAAGTVLGARGIKTEAGAVKLFVGSASKIEEFTSTGIVDRSRAGGYGTSFTPLRWWFTQGISANQVIATNEVDEMQVSTGGAFSNLANAPKARIVVSHSNALLAMNYNDGNSVPNGIKTSDRGDATNWTAGTASDATDIRLIETPGAIVAGAVLNDIVIAWKNSSMYVGRFVGGDEKWQFNLLSPHIGCFGMEAWTATPAGIIFAGPAGVYIFDGSVPREIDVGVRQAILEEAYISNKWGQFAQMSHDEYSGCVFLWMLDPASNVNFRCYAYNYRDGRWAQPYPMNDGSTVYEFGADGVSDLQSIVRDLNVLDYATAGNTNATGVGHFVFAGDKKLYNLSGDVTQANLGCRTKVRFKTGRIRLPLAPNADMTLRRVYPIFGSASIGTNTNPTKTMACSVTAYPAETYARTLSGASTTTATWDSSAKRFDVFATGKHFELTIESDVSDIVGLKDIKVDIIPAGAT